MDPILGSFVIAICAGLTWTCFGYLKDYRKNHTNPKWEGFDKIKLRNDIILGVVLGIATILAQPFLEGTVAAYDLPEIDSVANFVLGVGAMISPVVFVDKFIFGTVFGKTDA